jgi:hypothetical protein
MQLLTKTVEKSIPPLYSQEENPDPQVVAKFFNPCGAATWYILEGSWKGEVGDPDEDFIMFGLCDLGMGYPELGYVSLKEMKAVRLPFGLGIERDLHWTPKPLSIIKEKVGV